MKENYPWIQALRAVAALLVLHFHLKPYWDLAPILRPSGDWFHWGFFGVDIFFALSGFVVYRSARYASAGKGMGRFLWRRLSRIYLGYWPVFFAVVLFAPTFLQKSILPMPQMVGSFFLLYPDMMQNWIVTAWSLTFEIMFYLWLFCFFVVTKNPVKLMVAAAVLLAAWNFGWLLFRPDLVFSGTHPARYLLTALGIEFLAGALIYELYERRRDWFKNTLLASLLALCLIALGLSASTVLPGSGVIEILRVSTFGLAGLGFLLLAVALGESGYQPPRSLVAIGDASYSLYLLHPYLLSASGVLREGWAKSHDVNITLFTLATPVCIVIVCVLWFRLVEAPIFKLAGRLTDQRKTSLQAT